LAKGGEVNGGEETQKQGGTTKQIMGVPHYDSLFVPGDEKVFLWFIGGF